MNWLTIIISILSVLVIIFGFTTFNLLKKVEKSEDILMGYLRYLDQISRIIEFSDEKLKKLDVKGHFRSDDEVNFFFKGIQDIQRILNEFRLEKM